MSKEDENSHTWTEFESRKKKIHEEIQLLKKKLATAENGEKLDFGKRLHQWNEWLCVQLNRMVDEPVEKIDTGRLQNILEEVEWMVFSFQLAYNCTLSKLDLLFSWIIDPCFRYLNKENVLSEIKGLIWIVFMHILKQFQQSHLIGYSFFKKWIDRGYERRLLEYRTRSDMGRDLTGKYQCYALVVVFTFLELRVNYREQVKEQALQSLYVSYLERSIQYLKEDEDPDPKNLDQSKNKNPSIYTVEMLDLFQLLLDSQDPEFRYALDTIEVTLLHWCADLFKFSGKSDRHIKNQTCKIFSMLLRFGNDSLEIPWNSVISLLKDHDKLLRKHVWELLLESVRTPRMYSQYGRHLWKNSHLMAYCKTALCAYEIHVLSQKMKPKHHKVESIFHACVGVIFHSFLYGDPLVRQEFLKQSILEMIFQQLEYHVCDCPLFPALTAQVLELMLPRMTEFPSLQQKCLNILQKLESVDGNVYPSIIRRSKLLLDRYFFHTCIYDP